MVSTEFGKNQKRPVVLEICTQLKSENIPWNWLIHRKTIYILNFNEIITYILRKKFSTFTKYFSTESTVCSVEKRDIISHTVWKLENLSPAIFSQKFRQSYFFTKEWYCKLISRSRVKFPKLHTVCVSPKKYSVKANI